MGSFLFSIRKMEMVDSTFKKKNPYIKLWNGNNIVLKTSLYENLCDHKKLFKFSKLYDFSGILLNTNPLRHGYGAFYIYMSMFCI